MTPTKEEFRLAIVGAGAVVSQLHLPAILASNRVVVAAIVDPVTERAKSLVAEFGLNAAVAGRIEDVLGDVDGALIATPNNTHCDIALKCIEKRVHCLIEKPLAVTVAEAEKICRSAQSGNVVVAAGYSTRFRNEVVLLKGLLDVNYFGAVRRFHFQEGTVGGWSPASGYNLDKAAAGGGVLSIVGAHFIDRMLYWFGYPDACQLYDDSAGGPEAHCYVTFEFQRPNRFEGSVHLSKTFGLPPGLVIDTDAGLVLLGLGAAPLYLRPRNSPDIRLTIAQRGPPRFPRHVDNFQLQIEDFVRACRGMHAPLVPAEQALQSVRLLSELYAGRLPLEARDQAHSGAPKQPEVPA